MRLLLLHPEVAMRDCDHCRRWLYDDKTGQVVKRGAVEVERPAGTLPPCRTHVGCPKGTPEAQRTLSRKNRRAWQHYRECVAVRRFPDDGIVRRNAALIRGVEDSIRDMKLELLMMRVGALGPWLDVIRARTGE